MSGIVEIRDYTIEAKWFEQYVEWAKVAAPWLKKHLDVIDFWVDGGVQAELDGSDPQLSPHGQPNVTWIIRYADKRDRDEKWSAVAEHPEWQEIWSKHPNVDAYIVVNARFMKSL